MFNGSCWAVNYFHIQGLHFKYSPVGRAFFSLHLSTKNLEEQLEIILKSKKNTSTHLIFRCIVIFQHVRLLGLFALDDDDENDL